MNNTYPFSVPPNHRDLYVIVAGILLGVILGPAVMGRVLPEQYKQWFVVPVVEPADPGKIAQQLAAISATGATHEAVQEKLQELEEEAYRKKTAAESQAHQIHGRAPALILAALVMMVLESLLPAGSALRGRLVMVRYGLIALWLALLMAQPAQLRSLPMAFTASLVVVSLLAALLPLPRNA